MSSRYKLLWLKGPLEGRELCLPLGKMSIGPDGDVLATLLESKQLDLFIDEEGVHCRSEVTGWIGGQLVNKLDALPLYQVIEIDNISIVIGKADDELKMRAIPKRSRAKVTKPYWVFLLMSFLTLLLLFTVILAPSSQTKVVLTQKQWLSQQLIQDGLNDIKVTWSTSGVATLSGYCRDVQQIAGFFSDLKSKDILFVDHTQCGDQLISNVKNVLAQNGFLDAVVELGHELGSVTISGAISSGSAWDKAVDAFNNLPGLISWQVSNQVESLLKPLILQLRQKQLLEGLMIAQVKNTIVITGKMTTEIEKKVMEITSALDKSHPSGLKFVFQNIPVHDELTKMLSSSVVSYGGNTQSPFIELVNGVRLSVGSKLANGFVIDYMNVHGLDLSRGGELVHLPLIF